MSTGNGEPDRARIATRPAYVSPLLGLPVPGDGDLADGPGDIGRLVEALEAALAQKLWSPGDIKVAAYQDPPAGGQWLLCDGREYTAGQYPNLWNAIGVLYGGNQEQGRFNVPNLTGRCIRVDRAGMGPGQVGADTVALAVANLPAHNHAISGNTGNDLTNHWHTVPAVNTGNQSAAHTHPISAEGGFIASQYGGWNLQTVASGGTGTRNWLHTPWNAGPGGFSTGNNYQNHTHTVPAQNTGGISANHQHGAGSLAIGNAGSGTAHENRPASLNVNAFIKT